MSIIALVNRARREPIYRPAGPQPLETEFVCKVIEPIFWDRMLFEHGLGLEIPEDLVTLWNTCSGLSLYEDSEYGQSGMVVLSPDEALGKNHQYRERRSEDVRPGDLVFARFRGDQELALVRADRAASDYGAILIVEPMDPRPDWDVAAASLEGFLTRFMDTHGDKYWEVLYPKILAARARMGER